MSASRRTPVAASSSTLSRWPGTMGLLDLFGVPAALLPEVGDSDGSGLVTSAEIAGFEAPVAAMLGDQQAALYGQGCTAPRMAALTLGTGAFVWMNAGGERPDPPDGVLATVAWQTGPRGPHLRARGVRRERGQRARRAARERPGRRRIGGRVLPIGTEPHPVVVPAPAGLGTPHWHGADRDDRGRREQRDDGRRPRRRLGGRRRPPDRRRARRAGVVRRHRGAARRAAASRPTACSCRPWPTSPGGCSRSPPISRRRRAGSRRWPRRQRECSTRTRPGIRWPTGSSPAPRQRPGASASGPAGGTRSRCTCAREAG